MSCRRRVSYFGRLTCSGTYGSASHVAESRKPEHEDAPAGEFDLVRRLWRFDLLAVSAGEAGGQDGHEAEHLAEEPDDSSGQKRIPIARSEDYYMTKVCHTKKRVSQQGR